MKVYYFLNNISKESFDLYISKFELLKNNINTLDLINKFYVKIGMNIENAIYDANFLEALSFIEFLKKKYNLSYLELLDIIKWVHNDNFFIYNESIYIQENDNFNQIDTKKQKLYFVTSRDFFTAPFFLILNSISKTNKNIKVVKFNNRIENWSYNDKSYYISKLYKNRKELIGDIVFPFFQNKTNKNIKLFFQKIKIFLGNEIMLKKNFGDMGIGLKAIKLDDLPDEKVEFINDNFFPNNHNFNGIYITPYINIKKEYRVYYRYNDKNNKTSIYSIKNRVNKIGDEVFSKPNFKLYENVKVEWQYMETKNLIKKYIDKINKICNIIQDNCGVLEIFEDKNGKIYFCEINSLGSSLMFFGQDEKDMLQYYTDTWKMIY